MNRTLRGLSTGLLLIVLTACTQGAPTGSTLPPLTTSAVDSSAASTSVLASTSVSSAGVTSDAQSSVATTTDAVPPVDVTVPAEASALPLPTEQIDIPADNAQEQADRAAIKSVWRQVWDLYRDGYGMSDIALSRAAAQVSVDPIYSQLVDGSAEGRKLGLTTYGDISLHPFWYQPVDGKVAAVIGDCIDFSAFGEVDPVSATQLPPGKRGVLRVGHFVKDDLGRWKLWQVTQLPDMPCTP